ncbi:unnamed protein product, partial [Symbiodinium microadriaticum]
ARHVLWRAAEICSTACPSPRTGCTSIGEVAAGPSPFCSRREAAEVRALAVVTKLRRFGNR